MSTTPELNPSELETVRRFGIHEEDAPADLSLLRLASLALLVSIHHGTLPTAPVASSATWAARKNLYVLDAGGWSRKTPALFDASWATPITEHEFDRRCALSTTRLRSETDLSAHAAGSRI